MTDRLYLPDLGNGQYQNPILLCDYSDPDVIRVGDTYYLTASSFNYVPGLPILTSKDLVNWTLVNYALPRIPEERYNTPRHAQGVWAPAIRYHDGLFYICYGMPDEGIFMVRTDDPLGEWDAPVCVLAGKGLIDPCPFWDDDGKAYIIHGYARSRIGFKSFLGIFPVSEDGLHAIGEDHILYNGLATQPTIEGPKVYKKDGYYYLFAPAGSVEVGWQTVLRSKDIHGPYEEKIVLRQGDTPVNGPHQGGWVTTPDGQDWFVHFQSKGPYGRVVHLQPMYWAAGCPVMGDNGQPVLTHAKPSGPACEPVSLQASDDFKGKLNIEWQFMGNPSADGHEVLDGKLRLFARPAPEPCEGLWGYPNIITQKICCANFAAEVTVDASELDEGAQAGMALFGSEYCGAIVYRTEEGLFIGDLRSNGQTDETTEADPLPEDTESVRIRMQLIQTGEKEAQAHFYYYVGEELCAIGSTFCPGRHTWVGARIALFCTPFEGGEHSWADFSDFRVLPEA